MRFEKPFSNIKKKNVNWKDPLEEINTYNSQLNKQIEILKRSKYVMNILYNDKGIYLSQRSDPNKEMYSM